jgi:hypothetical protein
MKSVRVVGEVVGEVVAKALDIGEDREGVNEAQYLGNVVRRDMLKLLWNQAREQHKNAANKVKR